MERGGHLRKKKTNGFIVYNFALLRMSVFRAKIRKAALVLVIRQKTRVFKRLFLYKQLCSHAIHCTHFKSLGDVLANVCVHHFQDTGHSIIHKPKTSLLLLCSQTPPPGTSDLLSVNIAKLCNFSISCKYTNTLLHLVYFAEMIFSGLIHADMCISSSFLIDEYCTIVWIYCNFSATGLQQCVYCFQFLETVNKGILALCTSLFTEFDFSWLNI